MFDDTLFGDICNIIIFLSAVSIAATNLYKFFAKPTSFLKKKSFEAEKRRVEEIVDLKLKEKMPNIIRNHELASREQFLDDRQNCLKKIKEEVESDISEIIQEIHSIVSDQNDKIEILADSSRDVLREKIMAIYHQYKKQKSLPIHAREAVDQYYKDYKKQNGNSYIDKYYARIKTWDTYDDEEHEY